MKFIDVIILTVTLASVAPAIQNNTDEKLRARNAPGVFVYSASAFGPDKNGDSTFTIEVGNTGTKVVSAIDWEYCSPGVVAEDARESVARFRESKLNLTRNERRKLTERVHRYTNKLVTGFNLDTVRIIRVEYEDGSSWLRKADPK